jgi:hypothetical protein
LYTQDRLYCGAQHLFFTSIFGSVLGDDGKYDAFETILEILRARRAHPGQALLMVPAL